MRDTMQDAIPLMIRQQKSNPNTTHAKSQPQMQTPATIPATLKINPIMLNGEVLVDSCFPCIFSIVLITPDFFFMP